MKHIQTFETFLNEGKRNLDFEVLEDEIFYTFAQGKKDGKFSKLIGDLKDKTSNSMSTQRLADLIHTLLIKHNFNINYSQLDDMLLGCAQAAFGEYDDDDDD